MAPTRSRPLSADLSPGVPTSRPSPAFQPPLFLATFQPRVSILASASQGHFLYPFNIPGSHAGSAGPCAAPFPDPGDCATLYHHSARHVHPVAPLPPEKSPGTPHPATRNGQLTRKYGSFRSRKSLSCKELRAWRAGRRRIPGLFALTNTLDYDIIVTQLTL
jgi:hypothetical protein